MEIRQGIEGLRSAPPGAVLSVGNFDGMHRGHKRLLELAGDLRGRDGGKLVVVTFEPHPLTVLRPEKAPPRLTPANRKHELLDAAGVDLLVELPPAREVLDLTAEDFWAILKEDVQVRHLVEGPDFNFGKGRGGSIEKLQEWASGTAVQLHVMEPVSVPLLDLKVAPVSSSLIRWLLSCGRVREAAICLGRCYELIGPVVKGFERGRTIGMPTANLGDSGQMVPLDGVYVGRCTVEGKAWPAAVSIGTLPTFGHNRRQIEAHLLEFSGDLYGRQLRVEVVDWLREQRKFPGVGALMQQMQADLVEVRRRWMMDAARPIAAA